MRRFLNIGAAFVLALSFWGSALALPCPHDCHASRAVGTHAHGSDASPVEHCKGMAAEGETQETPAVAAHEPASSNTRAVGDGQFARRTDVFESAPSSCHCVGRTDAPPSASTNRDAVQLKRFDAVGNALATSLAVRADFGFVREIVPYEEGPPPSPVHRHILINVFRI